MGYRRAPKATVQTSFLLDFKAAFALEDLLKKENISMANLMSILIVDLLIKKGLMKKEEE